MNACLRCPYDVLGLSPGAERAAVRRAYKRLAVKLHPDKTPAHGIEGPALERHRKVTLANFQELQAAYELLRKRDPSNCTASKQSTPQTEVHSCAPVSPLSPSTDEDERAARVKVLRRVHRMRDGGAVRSESTTAGISLGTAGFEPEVDEATLHRLLAYRQRFERARIKGARQTEREPTVDSVRAALWDLDRTGLTVELLRDSGLGVELNKPFWLQHEAEDVAEMCVDLLARWRAAFEEWKARRVHARKRARTLD